MTAAMKNYMGVGVVQQGFSAPPPDGTDLTLAIERLNQAVEVTRSITARLGVHLDRIRGIAETGVPAEPTCGSLRAGLLGSLQDKLDDLVDEQKRQSDFLSQIAVLI